MVISLLPLNSKGFSIIEPKTDRKARREDLRLLESHKYDGLQPSSHWNYPSSLPKVPIWMIRSRVTPPGQAEPSGEGFTFSVPIPLKEDTDKVI